jgi:hypothetical protein
MVNLASKKDIARSVHKAKQLFCSKESYETFHVIVVLRK